MTQDMKTILSSEMSPGWFWLPHQPSPLEPDLKSFVLLPGTPLPPNLASLSNPLTLGSCSLGINTPHHSNHADSPITLCHSLPGRFLLPCPSWFSRIKQIPQVPSSSSPAVPARHLTWSFKQDWEPPLAWMTPAPWVVAVCPMLHCPCLLVWEPVLACTLSGGRVYPVPTRKSLPWSSSTQFTLFLRGVKQRPEMEEACSCSASQPSWGFFGCCCNSTGQWSLCLQEGARSWAAWDLLLSRPYSLCGVES